MVMSLDKQIEILQSRQKGMPIEFIPIVPENDQKWAPLPPGTACNFQKFNYRLATQPISRTVWINCCPENLYLFGSKQEAEVAATHTRIALRKIPFSFTSGQFDRE